MSSTRAVRGVASVTGNATSTPPPPRPPTGLYHSTDGGQTFNFVWDGNGSIRGISRIALDPSNPNIIYATPYSQGTWRSDNGGVTWTLIKDPLVPQSIDNAVRAEIAVTKLPNGNTRLYLAQGASGPDAGEPPAEVWRTDDAQHATTTSGWTNLTTNRTSNYCTGQCWYDNYVVTPKGHPDWVYVGGSYQYGEYGFSSNGRAVLYSTNAGQTWSDLTADNTMQPKDPANCCDPRPWAANALHPDQHVLVVNPSNATQVFEGSDGGLMRSSGAFADQSSDCDSRPLGPISMAKCHELLSRVPTTWTSLNAGLSTLQFQSLSVNPQDSRAVMGGTQDNGTFQGVGDNVTWPQIIYGDGGQSGWNAAAGKMRFNSFFGQFHDANVNSGDPTKWYIIGGPIASSPEGSNFYVPIVADPNPAAANTIYEGSQSVWRTKDWGGDPTVLKATCPEFFVSGADPSCGDFVRIGSPSDLTANAYGSGRRNCCVSWIARTPVDTGTIWAATNGGRVFVTHNADAADPTAVSWTRIDSLNGNPATDDPQRSITSIAIDPNNVNHAWISYTGYNFNTPTEPGHVFSVTYDPTMQRRRGRTSTAARWPTCRSRASPSIRPRRPVRLDRLRSRCPSGCVRSWTMAGSGLPAVEVAGLTIIPADRKLYAATHGMGAWQLRLPRS